MGFESYGDAKGWGMLFPRISRDENTLKVYRNNSVSIMFYGFIAILLNGAWPIILVENHLKFNWETIRSH